MKTLDQIAAALAGYDPQALSVDMAQRFIDTLVTACPEIEHLSLLQSLGRVVAQDVISPIDVPAHDNSAMDGYAFAGGELASQAALQLTVVGTALAGKAWSGTVQPGQCVKIMTGAIMPEGLDTVIPQELTSRSQDTVSIPVGVIRTGDNRRFKGEDIAKGGIALEKGSLISPAALGLLASLGVPTVPVVRKLKVAYFSTGDEILSLGEPAREGAVYDSNRYTIHGLLSRIGVDIIDLGVVRDNPVDLEAAFLQAAASADAIITSGGVSVGEADHTKAMMKKLGDVAFWKIAMRPGRPLAIGRITNQSTILFGLPGNPVAVMVTFLAFVRPALLKMMGCKRSATPLLQAKSLETIRKKAGRTEYQRAVVTRNEHNALVVKTTGQQGSGVLSSMVQANGLLVLDHDCADIAVGDLVNVMMFDGVI